MSPDSEHGVPQDANKDWVASTSTGGEAQEFSIEAMSSLLEQAQKAREERTKADVSTIEQLIAKAAKLNDLIKRGQEQISHFTARFEANPPDPQRDQTEIELFDRLKASVDRTAQELLATDERIKKIFAQPDVAISIQGEGEKYQQSEKKHKEIEASIDQIKQLLDELEGLFNQARDLDSKIHRKEDELEEIVGTLKDKTDNPDIQAVVIYLTPGNWPQRSEQLQAIRQKLGPLKGKDKRLIDDCLAKYPGALQEYNKLTEQRKAVSGQIKEVKQRAESTREELTDFMFGRGENGRRELSQAQFDHLGDMYKQKVGRDYHNPLS